MAGMLKNGASANGGGLLTQAPPNTGAGWYSLATGAWPGVHGSTNNTFHVNGQPFANRTAAFDAGVLQAETLAQAAERGGKKVAQIEWAGGRDARDQRPDGRLPHASSPAAASPPTTSAVATMTPPSSASFGLQFDHPAGFAGQAPFPGAAPADATGWTNVPSLVQPGQGNAAARARLRGPTSMA